MRWLPYFNLLLLVAIAVVGGFYFFYTPEKRIPTYVVPKIVSAIPSSHFAQSEESMEKIGEGLRWVAPQMQLPDLRKEILYYGKNARPDFDGSQLQVGLRSTREMASMTAGDPVYLVYKKNPHPRHRGNYHFSPNNLPTPLWLDVRKGENESMYVEVCMCDERGESVDTPAEFKRFTTQAHKNPKARSSGWMLDADQKQYRVDSTLLVRQKARLIGPDVFLEMHGGEDYVHLMGKERIDFLDQETPYSCYVAVGDFLVWKGGRWCETTPEENTIGLPLMEVKKLDAKVASFELWNPEGSGKTLLSLVRTKDGSKSVNITEEFKFVGAKTWAQFIVENRAGERFILRPNDWLVQTGDSWKKLGSASEIDAYVDGKLSGTLFIFDKIDKRDGRQVLLGHTFNQARTETETVELTPGSTTSLANFYRNIPVTPPIKPLHEDGIDE